MSIINKKEKKPVIQFACSLPDVAEIMPIIPYSSYRHDWKVRAAKDAGANKCPVTGYLHSVSRCPGINNIQAHGWVVRAWQDLVIHTYGEGDQGYSWESATDLTAPGEPWDYISGHDPEDYRIYRKNWPLNTLDSIIKVQTGWYAKVPKGYQLLQLHPPLLDESTFTAVEGSYRASEGLAAINVPMYWHKLEGSHVIKAGTPLAWLLLVPDEEPTYEIIDYENLRGLGRITQLIKDSTFTTDFRRLRRFFGDKS